MGEVTVGAEREETFEVEGALLTDVDGMLQFEVLSTPGMIAMIERCAALLARDQLPEGKATVGFEVSVKHVGAAAKGATCSVRTRVREFADGRKLRFDVEVVEGDRTIGVGTHERRVVEMAPQGG